MYDVENPDLSKASARLKACLPNTADDLAVVEKARAQRIERVRIWNEGSAQTVSLKIYYRDDPQLDIL